MLKLEYLLPDEAWQPDIDTLNSFSGGCRACRVRGFARLVRLVTYGGRAAEGQMFAANNPSGSFWFEEEDFRRLRRQAEKDLNRQGGKKDFKASFNSLVGLYVKHQLRALLGVRRDWTPSFDGYVELAVPPAGFVVALVGRIREQPVYSPDFPGGESARHAGLTLPGGLTQYVINFQFAANRKYARRYQGPFPF
jgi:hypothetical protein